MITEPRTAATLCVSIVAYESDLSRLRATLVSTLAALRRARDEGLLSQARVVVLDNASSNAYQRSLGELISDIAGAGSHDAAVSLEFEQQASNGGFGSGHNRALADVDTDFLLVLNPDVELLEDALVAALAYFSEDAEAVAANPLSRRDDGSREYLCKRYPAVFDLLLRGFGGDRLRQRFGARLAHYEYRDLPEAAASPVTLASGACLFLRRGAFGECGGFDEAYFMYFEDFDLSLRLAALGRVVQLPAMQVVHHGGDAARKGLRHIGWFLRSALRFYHRHGWRWR